MCLAGLLIVSGLSAANAAPDSWAVRALRGMSLVEKVGQLFVMDVQGKAADEPGNQAKYGVETAAEVVERYHPGGIIYFNNSGTDNVDDPVQIANLSNGLQRAALASGARVPLIIATDQEGGRVTRIPSPATEYPASMAIGAGRSAEDARQLATINGRELRAMGINQDFAPDADVNSNPLNPIIGSRSFSADPALAGRLVAAEVDGYQQSISSAAKHFPGHGDAATDSHTGLPVIARTQEQWRETDLPPFQAAIKAGTDVIMTAHITVPSLDSSGEPATLSRPIITGILRDELGYDGVVVTDSLGMAGVRQLHPDSEIPVLALEAGVDQMLMPPDPAAAVTGVLDAVNSGRLTEQRIDQSVLRILQLKAKRGIVANPLVDPQAVAWTVGTPEHLDRIQRLTDRTTTVLRNDVGLLPLRAPGTILVTGWRNPDYPGSPADPVATLANQLGGMPFPTGANPTAQQIDSVVSAAGKAGTVVVLTNGLRTSTGQQNLLNSLLATGKPLVAVAVQEPYDVGHADAPTWLATYDWRDVTMKSLAKVLLGQRSPEGKLPVSIPAGDDPGKIVYPFGAGLSW
ncbi:glycoside hydrolase family 3 protein [Amycolatopsis pithecellobii]|uniref:beta-N-acetylhexosaminidase n=1 Tax=Amycolatopsis pithecellobii TaxID=664692 RepID=A0A6N7YSD4_9PSEU|nr:glycoside hydrolase family 3 protein [Amycolatopsis pithecellobii]MTD55935.1 glycoside hydrolase family 3 protein [Amycolatopsis pithecellobii]